MAAKAVMVANTRGAIFTTLKTPCDIGLFLLVVYAIIRNLAAASAAPLWYDEILTWTVSSQPSWAKIIKALMEGVDGQPPSYYLVEHISMQAVHSRELALRLPSVLAFPCSLICVYIFARRWAGDVVALLSAAFLLSTPAFYQYGAEARPYSLVVAGMATALVCYQRISSPLYGVAMGVVLAGTQAVHHYAVFSMVPFGLAEVVYLFLGGRFRWRVWSALACPLFPLGLAWPIVANFKKMYGEHFWSRYASANIFQIYGAFLLKNSSFGVLTALLCAGVILAIQFRRRASKNPNESAEVWGQSAVLLGFLILPLTTILATKILHGGMLDRYVLATVLPLAFGVGGIRLISKPLLVIVIASLGVLIGGRELIFWRQLDLMAIDRWPLADQALIDRSGRSDLLVVVADGLLFIPLDIYSSPEWRKRFVYLIDEEKAVAYVGTDSIDRNLVPLRMYLPFAMPNYSDFSRGNREFLLLVEPRLPFDWISKHLETVGSVELLQTTADRRLYLVKLPPGQTK